MNNRDRARQWLRDSGIEESLAFEFDEHAAEARGDTFECPYCGTVTKWQLKDATGENDKVNLNDTIDALIWTEEWMKTITEHTGIPTDEGTMIGWFSNAIMAGFDEGQRRMEKDKIEAIGWMYAQACSYVDEGIDIRKILVPDIMQAMEEDFLNAVEKEDDK